MADPLPWGGFGAEPLSPSTDELLARCERNPDDAAAIRALEKRAYDIQSSRLRRIGIEFREAREARLAAKDDDYGPDPLGLRKPDA